MRLLTLVTLVTLTCVATVCCYSLTINEYNSGRFATVLVDLSPTNSTIKLAKHSGPQEDCARWKDKAWPLMSFNLYESADCSGEAKRFTKCAEYGDHWLSDRWICGNAGDMTWDAQTSLKVNGGINGLRGYILSESSCPPAADGTQGEQAELDPGIGKCTNEPIKGQRAISIKNVKGTEIDGHTDWIDTDAISSKLIKRGSHNCKKFHADNSKKPRNTRTNSKQVGGLLQCKGTSACEMTLQEGQQVTQEITTTRDVDAGLELGGLKIGGSTTRSKSEGTVHSKTTSMTSSLEPGQRGKWVCDYAAKEVDGTFYDCDGPEVGGSVVIPNGSTLECRLITIN